MVTQTTSTQWFSTRMTTSSTRTRTRYYKRLRDEAPLYHNEELGFWALSRHRDVLQGFPQQHHAVEP